MSIQDIINYVNSWRDLNCIDENAELTLDQAEKFSQDLQFQVKELSFNAPYEGATIIPQNGKIGNIPAWEIAKVASSLNIREL